jgi:hypothetical protein
MDRLDGATAGADLRLIIAATDCSVAYDLIPTKRTDFDAPLHGEEIILVVPSPVNDRGRFLPVVDFHAFTAIIDTVGLGTRSSPLHESAPHGARR